MASVQVHLGTLGSPRATRILQMEGTMTKKRRAANPIYSKPLTLEELARKNKQPFLPKSPHDRLIVCQLCHTPGGTLVNKGGKNVKHYVHQDAEKCKLMQTRRELTK